MKQDKEDAIRRIEVEHQKLRDELRAVLTPQQYTQWDDRFRALRKKAWGTRATAEEPTTLPSVDEVFQRFDRNDDRAIEASELPDSVRQRMMIADTDRDGKVTREELTAARSRAGQN